MTIVRDEDQVRQRPRTRSRRGSARHHSPERRAIEPCNRHDRAGHGQRIRVEPHAVVVLRPLAQEDQIEPAVRLCEELGAEVDGVSARQCGDEPNRVFAQLRQRRTAGRSAATPDPVAAWTGIRPRRDTSDRSAPASPDDPRASTPSARGTAARRSPIPAANAATAGPEARQPRGLVSAIHGNRKSDQENICFPNRKRRGRPQRQPRPTARRRPSRGSRASRSDNHSRTTTMSAVRKNRPPGGQGGGREDQREAERGEERGHARNGARRRQLSGPVDQERRSRRRESIARAVSGEVAVPDDRVDPSEEPHISEQQQRKPIRKPFRDAIAAGDRPGQARRRRGRPRRHQGNSRRS